MHTVTFILENAYGHGQVKSRLWMFPTYILTSLLTQNAPKLLIHHIEIHDGQTKKTTHTARWQNENQGEEEEDDDDENVDDGVMVSAMMNLQVSTRSSLWVMQWVTAAAPPE